MCVPSIAVFSYYSNLVLFGDPDPHLLWALAKVDVAVATFFASFATADHEVPDIIGGDDEF